MTRRIFVMGLRTSVLMIALLGAAVSLATDAGAAVQVGGRAGYYHSTGDVFKGSGNLGGNGLWGLAASVSILLPIDVEFAYERYTKDFSFNQGTNIPIGGSAKYIDNAYLLTGKVKVPILGPVSPLWFHLGAGTGLHHIETNTDSPNQAVRDAINQTQNQGEWHAVAGADIKLSSLLVYGEYRFQDVTEKHGPRFNSIYAGVNLFFQ
jgi:hypothetical protein